MEIDRGRMLKRVVLAVRRRYDIRMAVPDTDRDDSAERVQITATFAIPDVLHLPFHDHDWLFVVDKNSRVQEFPAQAQDFVGGRAAILGGLMIEWRKLRSFHVFLNPRRRNAM